MADIKTALVLVLGFASVLAWELPAIPANRRAQYYVQHDDGGYKYGYDTGAGHSGSAVADAANQVQGEYSYVDEAGQRVDLKYTAGAGGFVPVTSGGSSSGAFGAKSSGFSSRTHSAHTGVIPGPSSAAVDPHFDPNADASYNFNINTDSYKRTEIADAKGNIQGQYSYSSPTGGSHAISYVAGEGTGFVVTSDASSAPASGYGYRAPEQTYLPPAASYAGSSYDGKTMVNPDGSFAFAYTTDAHNHHATADQQGNVQGSYSFVAKDGVSRKVDYTAGAGKGFVAKGDHLPVAPASGHSSAVHHTSDSVYQYAAPSHGGYSEGSDANSDGSYSYSYDAGTSAKHETADAQGNVAGSFSFVGGDGVNRKVSYTAGKDEGFLVTGDHLPAAPAATGQEVGLVAHNAFAHSDLFSGSDAASSGSVMASKDGAYSYSYTTGGKSGAAPAYKSATAGHNTFGVAATKSYASPVSVAGAHGSSPGHVMASKDGAYSYSYSTGGQSAVPSGASYKSAHGQAGYGSGAPSLSSRSVASGSHAASSGNVMASKDGAYSYSYTTGGQSAVPAAASFKSAHGQTGSYSSPSVRSGSHGATPGHVTASKDGAYSYSYTTGGHSASAPASTSGHGTFGSGAVKPYSSSGLGGAVASRSGSGSQGDASYSFSYDAGTHTHEQSSDPHNNVRGSYSFKAKDDGQVRKVDYTAGSSTGFVAKAAHLPVASTVAHGGAVGSARRVGSPAAGYEVFEDQEGGDASYAYSYNTDTSSKHETSDAQGNVVGTFSYVGPDGVNRELSYTAQKEAGFKAAGAHLPVSPSVGSGANVAARSSVAQSHTAVRPHAHARVNTDGNAVVSRYLPPANSQKFGYVYDTKA